MLLEADLVTMFVQVCGRLTLNERKECLPVCDELLSMNDESVLQLRPSKESSCMQYSISLYDMS